MPHDRFYGIAAEEIARHEVDKDLMARAYAMALGDPEKTKAIYIGIRAERLEDIERSAPAPISAAEQRARYLKQLALEFGFIAKLTISESTVPSSNFYGEREDLVAPVKLSDVAEAIGCVEFKVIDAVKSGLVHGIRDSCEEWWVSARPDKGR